MSYSFNCVLFFCCLLLASFSAQSMENIKKDECRWCCNIDGTSGKHHDRQKGQGKWQCRGYETMKEFNALEEIAMRGRDLPTSKEYRCDMQKTSYISHFEEEGTKPYYVTEIEGDSLVTRTYFEPNKKEIKTITYEVHYRDVHACMCQNCEDARDACFCFRSLFSCFYCKLCD
jgi:hypothetical protein